MKRGARQYSLWTIAITLVLLFALIPVLWLLSISLKPPSEITDQRIIPAKFSLYNYKSLLKAVFSNSPSLAPLVTSMVIALIPTVGATVLASFTAYAIARLD